MSHKPSHSYEDEPQEGEAGGENGDIGGLCADGEDDGEDLVKTLVGCVQTVKMMVIALTMELEGETRKTYLQSKHEVFVSCLNTCGTVEHLFARRCQYTKTTFRQQLLCTVEIGNTWT